MNLGLLWLAVIPGMPWLIVKYGDVPLLWALGGACLLLAAYFVLQHILGLMEIEGLEKRAIYITGCDTGFGNKLALRCLQRGMPVFAGCLNEAGAEELRKQARNLPGELDTIIVDVASDESVAKAAAYLDKVTEQYGGLHGVVNNAGIVGSTYYDDMLTANDYKAVTEVNTFGVIRTTQATKHLVKKTQGRIVTACSICSRVGLAGIGPYTVSKFAVSGYLEVIRQELRHFGVTVHILEPGFFKTPLLDSEQALARFNAIWKRVPPHVKEEYGDEFFHQSSEAFTRFLSDISSDRIELVVDAYFHALTARFPRLRYQIGADSKFIFVPLSYLPTGLRDAIITTTEKLRNVPVPHKAIAKYAK